MSENEDGFKWPSWMDEDFIDYICGECTAFVLLDVETDNLRQSSISLPVLSDFQFDALLGHLENHSPSLGCFIDSIELAIEVYLEDTLDPVDCNEARKWRRRYRSLLIQIEAKTYGPVDSDAWRPTNYVWLERYERLLRAVESNFARRGAPEKSARDKLILAIKDAYGNPAITEDNHFERTVEMVLAIVEGAPKDIHKTIRNAIKRDPYPYRND